MARLIESSLWVDFTPKKSPVALNALIQPWILDPAACLCEPIAFEVLRHATPQERPQIAAQFDTLPVLGTSAQLWRDATHLGQNCRDKGHNAGSLDLLIATLGIHHRAELVTFDTDCEAIARHRPLHLRILTRLAVVPDPKTETRPFLPALNQFSIAMSALGVYFRALNKKELWKPS